MNKSKCILLHLCVIPVIVLFLSSCENTKERGKWVHSQEGIRIFVPIDFEDKYDASSLRCKGDFESIEGFDVAQSYDIEVKDIEGKIHNIISRYPTIIDEEKLTVKENGNSGAKWVIIGNRDKEGRTNGYAIECRINNQGQITKYHFGDFKNDDLERGGRYVIDNDKNTTVFSFGRYKEDRLYQGVLRKDTGDSIGNPEIGLWNSDGSLDAAYVKFWRINNNICKDLGYNESQLKNEDITFTHRYFFWKRYKWYFFIGLSVIGFIVLAIGGAQPVDEETEEDKISNYKVSPWTKTKAYLLWLFLGLINAQLFYFRNYGRFILSNLFLWISLVASSKYFVLFGLEPYKWPLLLPYYTKYWASVLLICPLVLWVVSFFAIPYWVYILNFKVYRHNIYEKLIIGGRMLEYKRLCKEIPVVVDRDKPIVEELFQDAKKVYEEEQGALSKAFSWMTNSKVRHARNKAEQLSIFADALGEIGSNHGRLTTKLLNLLNIERKNAYRNLILAKELVFLLRNAGHKHQNLQFDAIDGIDINSPVDVHAGVSDMQVVDFSGAVIKGLNSLDSTFDSLKRLGFKDEKNFLVSVGVGAANFLVDSIEQENARRSAVREHYEIQSATLIGNIRTLRLDLLKRHAKMLRANEILSALSKANEVFVKAYTPIRDSVFGTDASFSGFINHTRRQKKNAANLAKDIAYLIKVCSEYNKINQSKI